MQVIAIHLILVIVTMSFLDSASAADESFFAKLLTRLRRAVVAGGGAQSKDFIQVTTKNTPVKTPSENIQIAPSKGGVNLGVKPYQIQGQQMMKNIPTMMQNRPQFGPNFDALPFGNQNGIPMRPH